MSLNTDDIKDMSMSALEKAKLFYKLQNDKDLQEYMISNETLFEELAHRDKAYAEGKVRLTNRRELSLRLKKRRDAL